MSSRLVALVVAGFAAAMPVSAGAQTMLVPAEPIIPMDEARAIAIDQGMRRIESIELDVNSGRWEVEGVDAADRDIDVDIDARTGAVLSVER